MIVDIVPGYGDPDGRYSDGNGDGGGPDGRYSDGNGDGGGSGGYGDGSDGDSDGGHGSGGGGGDGNYGGSGGYGDGDDSGGDSGGYGNGGNNGKYELEDNMNPGLKIVVIGGGYYAYVLIGWLRRVGGDEWEMVHARVIRKFGRNQSLAGLAKRGPYTGNGPTQLLEASEEPEPFHRLHIRRAIACTIKAWAKECPKPKDWKD